MYEVKYHIEEKPESEKEQEKLFNVTIEANFSDLPEEVAERTKCEDKSQLSKYLKKNEGFYFTEKLEGITTSYIYRDNERSRELEISEEILGLGINIKLKTYKKIGDSLDKILDLDSLYEFVLTGKNKDSKKV